MALTIHQGDPRAKRLTSAGRHHGTDSSSAGGFTESIEDDKGQVFEVGRGVNDPRITYFASYNTNGTKVYTYPNEDGNGLITTTVQP